MIDRLREFLLMSAPEGPILFAVLTFVTGLVVGFLVGWAVM